jgi:hypothetical protein
MVLWRLIGHMVGFMIFTASVQNILVDTATYIVSGMTDTIPLFLMGISFLFMPTVSGVQLWCKTRSGCIYIIITFIYVGV